jgi:hypothetical protein
MSPVCQMRSRQSASCRHILPNTAILYRSICSEIHEGRRTTKRSLNLIRVISGEREVRIMFSCRWSAVALPEICRLQIPPLIERRGGAQMLVRMVVAALCIQLLTHCARRSIVADSATLRAPIGSTPASAPGRALRQSQSRPDCQFKLSGLGDTWLDADDAASKSCPTSGRADGMSKSSCAAACSHGEPRAAADAKASNRDRRSSSASADSPTR